MLLSPKLLPNLELSPNLELLNKFKLMKWRLLLLLVGDAAAAVELEVFAIPVEMASSIP